MIPIEIHVKQRLNHYFIRKKWKDQSEKEGWKEGKGLGRGGERLERGDTGHNEGKVIVLAEKEENGSVKRRRYLY